MSFKNLEEQESGDTGLVQSMLYTQAFVKWIAREHNGGTKFIKAMLKQLCKAEFTDANFECASINKCIARELMDIK